VSLDRIKSTGRGKLQARVEVEGWPDQWVTSTAMEQAVGDGRNRRVGLKLAGLQIGARLNLPAGKLDAEGFRVQIEGVKRGFEGLASLRRKPTRRTYLSSYLDSSATTVNVFSTDGWPSSGVIHINTEVIAYSGVTATSFTGCTRGYWNTQAQAHFVQGASAFEADAAGIAYPPVTDVPLSIEGRRVWVYLYGEGNGLGGDGVQRWMGVASTCAKFEGATASFSVDPPTAILKQAIGGDAAQKIPIRGIYYPWSAPFCLPLTMDASTTVIVKVVGFYETQAEFCAALTTAIASATAGWGWTAGSAIYAEPTDAGFQIVYVTGPAGTPSYVQVGSADALGPAARSAGLFLVSDTLGDHEVLAIDRLLSSVWVDDSTNDPVYTVVANRRYTVRFVSPVPRAYFGDETPWTQADRGAGVLTSPTDADTYPGTRIYFGGLVALSADTLVGGEEPYEGARTFGDLTQVASFDSSARSARLGAGMVSVFASFGPGTRFRLGRKLATGNAGDLITYLTTQSKNYANAGAMPLVRSTDIAVSASDFDAAIVSRVVSDRVFVAMGQDITLEELLGAELAAAGLHWRIATDGSLAVRRIRLAASTDPASVSINTGRMVGGYPTIEEAANWGFVNVLKLVTGYDPIEDEHVGPEHHVVNVQASAPNRAAKTLEIAQKSIARARFDAPGSGMASEPAVEDAVRIARVWLGLLGAPYDVLSVPVTMHAFDATLGDAVAVTSDYVMDDDGTMGITGKLGILIGYKWDLETGKGTLELLMHRRNIAGYAPGFRVTSQTNVAGNVWDITLNVSELTDQDLSTWFAADDLVYVIQQDSTAPTFRLGTIDAVTGDVLQVSFTAAWVPGTDEWAIEPRDSSAYTSSDNLARFVFIAWDTGRIEYSGSNADARVFSP
jgi:hypothetical protein